MATQSDSLEEHMFVEPGILFIPAVCATLSALLLTFHTVLLWSSGVRKLFEKLLERTPPNNTPDVLIPEGPAIWAWKLLRLICCTVLSSLATISAFKTSGEAESGGQEFEFMFVGPPSDDTERWANVTLSAFFVYTTILAFFALPFNFRLRTTANFHLVILLLVTFAIYSWRTIVPLAFFPLRPVNDGGWLDWTQFVVLTFAAVIIPLCVPRVYVPLDPLSPKASNPEQTTPLISLVTFTFLDSIVWTAYRSGQFVYDQLPSLPDYDHASYLKQRSFRYIDPLIQNKEQNLFWGLMKVFWKEYTGMAVVLSVKALMEFAGPVSIRFLLEYLEDPTTPVSTRPWVWIAWLFLGPVTGSIALQWYNFLSSTLSIRGQGMLTQLLFEHSLRIRLISGTQPSKSDTKSQVPGADANISHSDEPSTSHTLVASEVSETTQVQDVPVEIPSARNLTGKINNLISEDIMHIADGRDFLYIILFTPIQLIFSVVFLYQTLGWSALIGMVLQILSLPLPGKVAGLTNRYQTQKMQSTDARVQAVTETMSIVRMIKLLAWERKVKEDIQEKREAELQWYKKRQFLELVGMNLNFATPIIVMAITFGIHTLAFKKPLTASMVFSTIGVFNVLRQWLEMQLYEVIAAIQAKVSLDRMTEFLYKTDLLDTYSMKEPSNFDQSRTPVDPSATGFRHATFAWSPYLTDVQRNFRLRIEDELIFHPGKISMITGPTGCGKTSVLLALLGEMHFIPDGPDSWFGLAREDGVAYAAQEPWIQNATIRENILFGAEYDEARYAAVIEQCALQRDLNLFNAGDHTEVGERGATLSGGQKARVSLARAIYSKAKTVLLDDVLSALDVHTCRWIVNRCLRGPLIADRTILIVTHHIAMVGEVADFVVSIGSGGRITSQGSVQDALRLNSAVRQSYDVDKGAAETPNQTSKEENNGDQQDVQAPNGNLVVPEEVAQGQLSWAALRMFWASLGGVLFWLSYGLGSILWDLSLVLQIYWLSIWARGYENHLDHPEKVDVLYYLAVYVAICTAGLLIYNLTYSIHVLATVRASRVVHSRLVASILAAPLRWLDTTPMGRITARFTQDTSMLDGPIPSMFRNWTNLTIQLLSRLVTILVVSPVFTIPAALITSLAIWIGRVYIAAQLPLKREMSKATGPLFSHLDTALVGIVSIRAYRAEGQFVEEASRRIDNYARAARVFNNLNRWVAIRMDTLGGIFLSGLASYLVYIHSSADASLTGFSLTIAITFSSLILMWVRMLNGFQLLGNSLERIDHYIQIEHEPGTSNNKIPPAYWPASGKLVVENLTARYSHDGPDVLHNISFQVNAGERIGIVGRTGSGKSSLALSLLKMIPTEGDVYYDDINIAEINLDALRSNITIIPQQPELMSGTVRQNLDPFGKNDDATLYMALNSAGLGAIQAEGDDAYIGLDTLVGSGGKNMSVGQRQILALARAIVRRSQILILDEATAAIDHTTDNAIQTSIRTELKGLTLLVVAHRLQTILVLDEGKIIEFDTPLALLSKSQGVFKSLVDESSDKDALYAAVRDYRL